MAAVPFLLGCLDAVRAPGPVIVAGLADLGYAPAATRTTLHRMVQRGQLTATREGRVTAYELAGPMLRGWHRMRSGDLPERLAWTGGFEAIVYEIGEDARRARDELRGAAFAARWAAARPGLLIGVTPRPGWLDAAIDRARAAGGTVYLGRFECPLDTAREVAASAWGLGALAAELRAATGQVAAVRAEFEAADLPAGDQPLAAYRALARLYVEGADTQLRDPGLPPELLPEPWPAEDMFRERQRLALELMPLVHAHLANVTAGAQRRVGTRWRVQDSASSS